MFCRAVISATYALSDAGYMVYAGTMDSWKNEALDNIRAEPEFVPFEYLDVARL